MKHARRRSEDDDGDIKNKSALPITKKRATLVNGVPLTGEDYLLFVREQSQKCAETKVAPAPKTMAAQSLPASYQFAADKAVDPALLPDPAWQSLFAEACTLHQKIHSNKKRASKKSRLPPVSQKAKWRELCIKPTADQPMDDVAHFSQKDTWVLIMYMRSWLVEDKAHEHWDSLCAWLFALLLHIDPVLTFDDTSLMRRISRTAIDLRARLEPSSAHVAQLNCIITIISHVFRQADLK
ncbi:survival motor neuron interacting protein 1-domain-containing protein [Gongronella butleri]|nr:survival motor neuron interacting protein 1-domain-containing protein [Gongronella butleri]